MPPGYPKAAQAARLILDHLGRPNLGAKITLTSQLPLGRGMASSTADVVGVMAGLVQILGCSLSLPELARLACQIEPSDSTMFAQITALAYRGTGRSQELGLAPALPLLMFDPGYAIDTLSFNGQLDLAAVRSLATSTQAAQELLQQGLAGADVVAIGAAATLSATQYQTVSYSPLVEQAQRWGQATGASGLIRAHSGSVVGLLYPNGTELAELIPWLSARFEGALTPTHLVNGGFSIQNHVAVTGN
jgi:L-threonine kinase